MIYADDRENEVLLHRLYTKVGNKKLDPTGQCVVKRLQYGDYIIGPYGIEAKEINDLYRSILGIGRNGRTIKHQIHELCEVTEYPILAVYNTTLKPYFRGRKATRNEVSREILRQQKIIKSFKMTLYSQFPKVRLIEFKDMDEFVEWLRILNTRQVINDAKNPPISHKKQIDDSRLLALMSIQGVNERIAIDLLRKFGSIPNMLKSKITQKEFMKVRGVGRVLARRLSKLRERWV